MRRGGVIAGTMAVSIATAAVVRATTRRFAIREASMEPALASGDWVIARRRIGIPDRGAIVVIADPAGSGMHLVKRVIGLPGEHIGIEAGRVTVNGALLADRWASGMTRPEGSWDLSGSEVWLLGDNRVHSVSDGRVLGPTSVDKISWVVVARYWPTARVGLIT